MLVLVINIIFLWKPLLPYFLELLYYDNLIKCDTTPSANILYKCAHGYILMGCVSKPVNYCVLLLIGVIPGKYI